MKKTLLSILGLVILQLGFAQTTMNCCAPTATEQFASFASNKTFVMAHEEPLPFTYNSARGNDITFKTPDGTDGKGWEVKAKDQTSYYLFVFHEYWGLNDYIKQESEKLSDDLDVNVIAVDLYDGKVATTREDAGKYMQAVKTDRAMAIIKGTYAYVGASAKVFTIGWCFGGGWSLQASLAGGAQAVGCVMYYGMPEKDVNKLKTLNCDVIGFFANKDKWITPAVVQQFKTDMAAAGKNITVYQYDADHAFANPSNPIYDKAATLDSYAKAIAFIKVRIK